MKPWADSQSDPAALWMLITKASMGAKLLGQRKKYRGHRVFPASILTELDAAEIM